MSLPSFAQLRNDADCAAAQAAVAVAGAADPTVLAALRQATDCGWVTPLLCGDEPQIRRVAEQHGVSLEGFAISTAGEPARVAVAAVGEGHASLLMKGLIATPALMAAVLASDTGLRTGRVICQVPLIEFTAADRRLLLAPASGRHRLDAPTRPTRDQHESPPGKRAVSPEQNQLAARP